MNRIGIIPTAVVAVLLTQVSCSLDGLLCANDKVQRVFVGVPAGEFTHGGFVMWAGDSLQLKGTAGLDPSAEFCTQDEVMFTVEANPAKFAWSTSDSSVVVVRPNGMLVTRRTGEALIRATVDGVTSEPWKYIVGPRLKTIHFTADPPVGKVGVLTTVHVFVITDAGDTLANPLIAPFVWIANGVSNGPWTKGWTETTENSFTPTVSGETVVSTHAYRTGGASFYSPLQYTVKP